MQPQKTVGRLRKRRDFVAAAKGKRFHGPAFSLQAKPGDPSSGRRVGFTVTRKVGHATERNRIRRRLREAVRIEAAALAEGPPADYVVLARREVLGTSFDELRSGLRRAFAVIDRSLAAAGRRNDERSGRT